MALTHASWGLKPILVRDLARVAVFPRADYGVNCFFPLPAPALKPLDKTVARCITGGYRTASLSALEKEAAILPVSLRLESQLLHRLASYLTLPESHGITLLIRDAIQTAPKYTHRASALHFVERVPLVRWPTAVPPRGARIRLRRSEPPTDVTTDSRAGPKGSGARGKRGGAVDELPPPPSGRQVLLAAPPVTPHAPPTQISTTALADVDLRLGMEQIFPTYAPPWSEPLPVSTHIPSKEDAIAALNAHLAHHRHSAEIWYTDGSLLEGSAGGAAVRVIGPEVLERILVPLGEGQVAEGEIEGLLRATERALSRDADQILIVSDSQAGLRGILSTAPRAGQSRAIAFDKIVRAAASRLPSLRITILWTPAHIGTTGNEFADDAAKASTRLPPSPSLTISLTSCKRRIDIAILEKWDTMGKFSSTGRRLREIDDSPPSLILRSPYLSSASRSDISIISRLRTDFSALNAHRFRLGGLCDGYQGLIIFIP
ncbi:hypothetical protein B0H14DRAFT_3631373 [Mycena olivaceomarginata]|nr:hypothetical protein B0H14DRAFT_3631373 [Mycena olivaceomarginata]